MARVEAQSGEERFVAWVNRSGVYELHLPFREYRITAHGPCHLDASASFTFHASQALHLLVPATAPAAPGAPQGVAATPGPGPDQVTLSWKPPQGEGSGPVTGYNVH
ncbi:MAG: fibronectin type III domain-containing protein, partial [Thermoplasmatota archaeon]